MGDEREMGKLEAKMDMLIESIGELRTSLNANYVQKVQFEDLKERVQKLENAPHKWVSVAISAISVSVAILALVFKH